MLNKVQVFLHLETTAVPEAVRVATVMIIGGYGYGF